MKKSIKNNIGRVVFFGEIGSLASIGKILSYKRRKVHHHIQDRHEMPNDGYAKENGICLCVEHHELAEAFHVSNGEKWTEGMHPDDLYEKIGSSREMALKACEEL